MHPSLIGFNRRGKLLAVMFHKTHKSYHKTIGAKLVKTYLIWFRNWTATSRYSLLHSLSIPSSLLWYNLIEDSSFQSCALQPPFLYILKTKLNSWLCCGEFDLSPPSSPALSVRRAVLQTLLNFPLPTLLLFPTSMQVFQL